MRKFSTVVRFLMISVVSAVVIAACGNLLQGNMFENFDGPPDTSDLLGKHVQPDGSITAQDAPGFIRDLEDAAGSPRFFRDLSGSDRAELSTALESVYANTDEVDVTTRQKAAVLAGEVNMRGTNAGETANNVIDVLTGDGIETFENPNALFDEIIPADAKGDPAKVKAILDNLVAAGSAYEAFGETLGDTGAPAGTNMGTVAQNAVVAITVKGIVGANTDTAVLAARIVAREEIESPDYGDDGVFGPEGSAVRNIFDEAGLGGVLDD